MTVKTFSCSIDGNLKLAANFTVREFQCQDKTDKILIDDQLPQILQLVRDHFNKPVAITSGYRTKSHNSLVGGASNSQHLLGTATDFYISGVAPKAIVLFLEQLGAHGLGLYSTFVHVDVRAGKVYWNQESGKYVSVSTFGAKPYIKTIQEKANIDDATAKYLQDYKYGYALVAKLGKAML